MENSPKPATTPQALKILSPSTPQLQKPLTVTIRDPHLGQCQPLLTVISEEGRRYQRDEPLHPHPADINTNKESPDSLLCVESPAAPALMARDGSSLLLSSAGESTSAKTFLGPRSGCLSSPLICVCRQGDQRPRGCMKDVRAGALHPLELTNALFS